MDKRPASRSRALAYMALLTAQTVVAGYLLWITVPIFRRLVEHAGEPVQTDANILVAIIGGALILQCCYWVRFRRVPVYAPFKSDVVAHLLLFAGRASFFLGGALFSAIFFRHVPELATFPPLAMLLSKIIAVFGSLFALFCYSLELDRLGRAVAGLR